MSSANTTGKNCVSWPPKWWGDWLNQLSSSNLGLCQMQEGSFLQSRNYIGEAKIWPYLDHGHPVGVLPWLEKGCLPAADGHGYSFPKVLIHMLRQSIKVAMPEDNAYVEALHAKLQREVIERFEFDSIYHAQITIDRYYEWYSRKRRHGSLMGKTPESVYIQYFNPNPFENKNGG